MYSTEEEQGAVKYLGRGIRVAMAVVKRRNVPPSEPTFESSHPQARHRVGPQTYKARSLWPKQEKYGDLSIFIAGPSPCFKISTPIVFTAELLPLSVSSLNIILFARPWVRAIKLNCSNTQLMTQDNQCRSACYCIRVMSCGS